MTATPTVAVLRDDGIGPEVLESALSIVGSCRQVCLRDVKVGGEAIDAGQEPVADEAVQACRESDAVLLGALGGPRWDNQGLSAAAGLLRLRRKLGHYANLRPVRHLNLQTPLRDGHAGHADVLVVRDLAGGV